MKKYLIYLIAVCLVMASCGSKLPQVAPDIVTEKVRYDTDDPAIWIHPDDTSKSIVFGTNKDIDGSIYAFDLQGKILKDKMIPNIKYPNNIDVEYGFQLKDTTSTDILVFTERERSQIRVFSVPDMQPLDNGGIAVFEDENDIALRKPMGIALYKNPENHDIYVIVSRKSGPKTNYLYQYKLKMDTAGIKARFIRKFGMFSGVKEIEAIAVDDELGYVYYSDEQVGIRKYYANPSKGNEELNVFGQGLFKRDIEGIAIATFPDKKGYIIVSDQQKGQFNIFTRTTNQFIKAVNLGTDQTDGCDVTTVSLNNTFKSGLFVSMNENRDFYFHDFKKLIQ